MQSQVAMTVRLECSARLLPLIVRYFYAVNIIQPGASVLQSLAGIMLESWPGVRHLDKEQK